MDFAKTVVFLSYRLVYPVGWGHNLREGVDKMDMVDGADGVYISSKYQQVAFLNYYNIFYVAASPQKPNCSPSAIEPQTLTIRVNYRDNTGRASFMNGIRSLDTAHELCSGRDRNGIRLV
jgi:hypothetical protein